MTVADPAAGFLETRRLRLQHFTGSAQDVENLLELDGDPEVMRFITGGAPSSRQEIEERFLPRVLEAYERTPGFGFWVAVEKETGRFVGWFHLRRRAGDPPDEAELGYRLRRSAWGSGLATEGSLALIHKGFTELGLHRITANTMAANIRSRRVMEKVGMTLVRSFHTPWTGLPIDGTEEGEVEYALLRSDWVIPS